MVPLLPVTVGWPPPEFFAVYRTVRLPARVTKVCVSEAAFPLPTVSGPVSVVSTGPVNTSEANDGGALP